MIAALTLAASAACIPTAQLHTHLAEQYHEARVAAGLTEQGAIFELWASPEGTWTALVTRPDGLSCMIGSGEAVSVWPKPAPGEPA